jgi:hypothetical protein
MPSREISDMHIHRHTKKSPDGDAACPQDNGSGFDREEPEDKKRAGNGWDWPGDHGGASSHLGERLQLMASKMPEQ